MIKQVDMLCSIEGCKRKRFARGYCGPHYNYWYTYGDPLATRKRRESGTGTLHDGYVRHGTGGKLIRAHQILAEKALGRQLPKGAQVHHVDENKHNNSPGNLVLCPSDAYHKLLHARQRAMDACGNPNYRKCQFCKEWCDPETMQYNAASKSHHHFACRQAYNKKHWAEKKEAS